MSVVDSLLNGTIYPNARAECLREQLFFRAKKYHEKNKELYEPICQQFVEKLLTASDEGELGVTMVVDRDGRNTDDMFKYICLQFPSHEGYTCSAQRGHPVLCDCDSTYGKGCITTISIEYC